MYRRVAALTLFALLAALPVAAVAQPAKLLIDQATLAPTEGEYVRIFNPNAFAVDLTDYYLSDYERYYLVVNAGAPGSSDFIVRFPSGATIAPFAAQIVSVAGAECFRTACGAMGTFTGFGYLPDYELVPANPLNSSAQVPDMLVPFAGASGASHALTNAGESLVLFHWNGASALVTDVDYVFAGTPSVSNPAVDKTGVVVNGSTYANDTLNGPTQRAPLSVGPARIGSARQDFTEGTQVASGGNGIGGRDETSEPTALTFSGVAPDPRPDALFGDSFE